MKRILSVLIFLLSISFMSLNVFAVDASSFAHVPIDLVTAEQYRPDGYDYMLVFANPKVGSSTKTYVVFTKEQTVTENTMGHCVSLLNGVSQNAYNKLIKSGTLYFSSGGTTPGFYVFTYRGYFIRDLSTASIPAMYDIAGASDFMIDIDPANSDELEATIGEYEQVTNIGYTDESWDNFTAAILFARSLLEGEYTQDDIDNALQRLTESKLALTMKPPGPVQPVGDAFNPWSESASQSIATGEVFAHIVSYAGIFFANSLSVLKGCIYIAAILFGLRYAPKLIRFFGG